MRPLVGADRQAIIHALVADFDAISAGRGPRVVSLEASVGLGKTRLAQELFIRLATDRQPRGPYWPARLDWQEHRTNDVLQARKQVEPTPGWVIPGGTQIPWLWWGITCQLTHAGNPMRAMKDASDQLRAHLDPLQARLQAADRSRDDALEVLAGVFDLVGVVNPGAALDAGSKFLGVFRRRREQKRLDSAASMDRRVEVQGESYAEAARIADGLTAVARAQTPVVLVIDDAQWADPALVSLLRHLTRLEDAPILIVTSAWPEQLAVGGRGAESFAGWLERTSADFPGRLRRIPIGPLQPGDLAEMILGFAPRTNADAVDRLAAIASGNPLVMNLLLDLDVIRRDVASDSRIDTDPATLKRLPSSLRAIYQDLWKQLPDAERRVLALVAVQGPEFLPGFVESAAINLEMHSELMPAFERVRDVHGWIRPVNNDRYEFAEHQRFDVADDNVREIYPESSLATIRDAILGHVLTLRRSERWQELDLRTRRVALESHLELNEQLGEDVERDVLALADSMEQLAALDVDAGDAARAAELLAKARTIREASGVAVPFEQVDLVIELSREVEQEVASEATIAPAPPSPGGSGSLSWTPHAIPALTELPPSAVAELIVEIVGIEGPVYAGQVYRSLIAASGASRQGKRIRAALDSGVRSAARRGLLVASMPDAGGASDRRVLRLPSQPDVSLVVAVAVTGSAADETPVADEWGRIPWLGWQPHDMPDLSTLAPRDMADAIVEIVSAEGPVLVGRVLELLRRVSGAGRMSKSIRHAVESGVGSGVRRGELVLASGRRGEPDSRVLRLPNQPEVVLRVPGDRNIWSIPGTELVALAAAVRRRSPGLDLATSKREVARLCKASRYTAQVDKLLEAAVMRADTDG